MLDPEISCYRRRPCRIRRISAQHDSLSTTSSDEAAGQSDAVSAARVDIDVATSTPRHLDTSALRLSCGANDSVHPDAAL